MKAAVVQEDKTIRLVEKPMPVLKSNEILLKTKVVGLNPTDWKHLHYISSPGQILGCDFVGEVVQLGPDVPEEVRIGELRWGFMRGGASKERGAFAEFVAMEWDLTSVVPPNISADKAASIPIPFMTAVQAFYLRLGLPGPPAKLNGEWILIWGGNTAVGRYAIQLAKLSGLKVATTASERNWAKLKALGADMLVDYKDPEVVEKLKAGTNNSIIYGLDCVSENGSIQSSQRAFSPAGGHLICTLFDLGEPARADVKTEATLVYSLNGLDVHFGPGATYFTTPADRPCFVRWVKVAKALFEKGEVKPLQVTNFGKFEDLADALEELRKGRNKEKLVVSIG